MPNPIYRRKTGFFSLFLVLFVLQATILCGQSLQLNDSGYFAKRGVNVFVFNNLYNGMFFDEKTAGIEIIHHGVRTSTGGAVRLQHTPEQWDLVPLVINRKVDKASGTIEVTLRYQELDFDSRIRVSPKGKGVEISVYLDKELPAKLEGNAGFNLEFLPTTYFEKSYLVDGHPGYFPLYPADKILAKPIDGKIQQFGSHTTFDDRGRGEYMVPLPLANGKNMILAPEDAEKRVLVQSDSEIMLFDGRNLAQNGWFILRSLLPVKKSGKVLTWYLEPNAIPNWKRKPVIQFSQAGYLPGQQKLGVIELDKYDTPLETISLYQVNGKGLPVEKLKIRTKKWGPWLRYQYLQFDFSAVKETGVYYLQYGNQKTNTFPISGTVYEKAWHATMDVWFPVQMDHMQVNEAYRVWHGVPYLDDALQAPVNQNHFDGYSMGPTTDTKYKPYERIPGLAIGGWFDAGDFDIQTGSHNATVLSFVQAWEDFKLDRDNTFIDQQNRFVDIHRPDGKPDILQQIEHGTLNIVAQVKNIGHPVRGIVVPKLHQYHHLGDASTETDNLPYNPLLKPYESDGKSSGTPDDRWAFTNRSAFLDYHTAASLAAASRAMRGYNDTLADQCLYYARELWAYNDTLKATTDTASFFAGFRRGTKMNAALQLYITTKDERYANQFKEALWTVLDRSVGTGMLQAMQALPFMDKQYKDMLRTYIDKYRVLNESYAKQNPYGVPMVARGWGGNSMIINWAITNYYANKYYPDLIDKESVYKGLHYLYGCHPYSNISFVSGVGTHSKRVTYGSNRADFSFIAGGVVPGLLILKPDFPENKEDWPFLWGENEVVIDICAAYIFLSNAVNRK